MAVRVKCKNKENNSFWSILVSMKTLETGRVMWVSDLLLLTIEIFDSSSEKERSALPEAQ